jgi:hypothetical protein
MNWVSKTKVLFSITVAFFFLDCDGQNQDVVKQYGRAVKINLNYTRLLDRDNYHLGDIAPLFLLINPKQNLHEFELNRFELDKSEATSFTQSSGIQVQTVTKKFIISLRYQYTWSIIKMGRWLPQLGFTFLCSSQSGSNHPQSPGSYDRSYFLLQNIAGISPQLRYNLSERLFFDLAIPIDIIDLTYDHQKILNPYIPKRQQSSSNIVTSLPISDLDVFHLRLGVGIKF